MADKNFVVKGVDKKVVAVIEKLKTLVKDTAFEGKTYLVGGCIRDMILGKPVKDIDIVVDMPNGGVKLSNYITLKT
jgi:tRNA nucleotidyltransferase/poly(A) polymerase